LTEYHFRLVRLPGWAGILVVVFLSALVLALALLLAGLFLVLFPALLLVALVIALVRARRLHRAAGVRDAGPVIEVDYVRNGEMPPKE
jgi:hypothetical protein